MKELKLDIESVIAQKGDKGLRAILGLVDDNKLIPENCPIYDGKAFVWAFVPFFLAQVEKELTEYFGFNCNLGFSIQKNWFFVSKRNGLCEEVSIRDLEDVDTARLLEELDWMDNDILNEHPFKVEAIMQYASNLSLRLIKEVFFDESCALSWELKDLEGRVILYGNAEDTYYHVPKWVGNILHMTLDVEKHFNEFQQENK